MARVPHSIVVPVWGQTHVARFLEWALPTWLSPRNLPELASRGPLELILLTSRKDFQAIQDSGMLVLLRAICEVKLIDIDDLIVGGVPTVTLTLAFTRGVNIALSEGQHRRLIFLNGDFLLSDGSLASIADRFDAGQELLLCSSVRVREEVAGRDFIRMRRADGVMVLPARSAVKIALGALHPTVLACRVDQPLLSSAHPNQFFWQPNSSTLVLRAFLLFPLAVAPKRLPGPANTYCDYGWIATMVEKPSIDIVDTSDELFIVELSPTNQEIDFVKLGPAAIEDCARQMSDWMTDFSSAQAGTPIIFKAADATDATVAEAVVSSRNFIEDLQKRFGPLRDVHNHPYWLGGASAYLRNRRSLGIEQNPVELSPVAELPPTDLGVPDGLRHAARAFLMGAPGRRQRWHPYWRADRIVRRIGQLRPVGMAAMPGQLALVSSPTGTLIEAIESNNVEGATMALARFAGMVKEGTHAYLIVGRSMQSFSGQLTMRDFISALSLIERQFRILSVTPLVNRAEADAAARHRRLATEIRQATPLHAFMLVLASVFSLGEVVLNNLLGSADEQPIQKPAVLLLELCRNKTTDHAGP
jgi:hypothetical protein